MKKLIVLLLALATVGAVSAQVTTSVSLSGSVYLERSTNGVMAPISSLSPNGAGYDVLTFSASKDKKFGFEIVEKNVLASPLGIEKWNVWYDLGILKATMGNLDGGSYVQYFNNGWIESLDPIDNMSGTGLLIESCIADPNFKLGLFAPMNGGATSDMLQKLVVGGSYTAGSFAKVVAQVNLDLVTPATSINMGFDFTGVKNLDVYGWAQYQINAATVGFGVGGQYKTSAFRLGAEVEGEYDTSLYLDAVVNARFYITSAFFAQLRGYYYTLSNTANNRFAVRGYLNYAFGNGFAIEPMVGFDSKPSATTSNSLVQYVRLTYSVAF